ncbi:hypothetical protein ACP70R_021921 [Stipagrostis hirtigluma subsp. patula]
MALPEELVEEILLRFPPDDPASLLRAALVCKPWCGLISGSGFRRRLRDLHRTPPVLGLCYLRVDGALDNLRYDTRFVPTTSFCPPRADLRCWDAIDCRHGRVLLIHHSQIDFVVWDPITDEKQQLPGPQDETDEYWSWLSWNAAVLCAGGGACDHLDCHRGNFNVVLVCTTTTGILLYVYSSEAGAWSQPASLRRHEFPGFLSILGTAVVGSAPYFLLDNGSKIFKYELGTQEVSLIQGPPASSYQWPIVLMTGGWYAGICHLA